ncbi:MAG: S1C family serine protease [Dehalococcoidia bacterium]
MGSEEGFWRRFPPLALLIIVLIAFAGGALAGGAVSVVLNNDDDGAADDSNEAASTADPGDGAAAATVSRVLPSVVTIINEQPDHIDEQGNTIGTVAIGSGFIVDNRGFIVTNEHVIHDVGTLTVVLSNGDERPAQLVSHDAPFTDLAVIKIPPGGLRALRWGDSAKLSLGQPVIAIGTALFEFRNSVTVGVVSGLQRRWLREGVYMEDLVQTDALLNAGNSGGPLLTLDGEVIGINSTVVRTVNGVETVTGIAFALSSRTVQPIVQGIIDKGAYSRPFFGIDHQNIDQEFLLTSNLRVDHGALVQRVTGDSPAAKAGIQAGDVLLRIGRNDITEDQPFINVLSRVGVNDRVDVQVWREGRVFNTQVQVVPR